MEKTKFVLEIPTSMNEELKLLAKEELTTKNALIRAILKKYLAKKKKEKEKKDEK